MKYTRLELQSNLSKNTIKNIIVFFVIIPAAAIFIGKIITGIAVLPYINSKIQPVQYVAVNSNSKSELNYYILQAGVFIDKDNAEILLKGINKISKNSFILNDADSYRVIVDISEDKKNVDGTQVSLKKSGYSCIISNINFSSENAESAYSADISEFIDLINLEKKYITDAENNKEISIDELNNHVKKINDIIEKAKAGDKSTSQYNILTQNYSDIVKYSNIFITDIKDKNILNAKTCIGNQILRFKNIYMVYTEKASSYAQKSSK